jgi:hypothetical protein
MLKHGDKLCDHPLIINYEDLPQSIKNNYESFCEDFVIKSIVDNNGTVEVKNFLTFYGKYKNITIDEFMGVVGCLNIKKLVEKIDE